MAFFQSTELAMLGVDTKGEPALPAGVHLRWGVAAQTGLPPWGFALYRRESKPTKPICLSKLLPAPSAGAAGYRLTVGDLSLESHRPLMFVPGPGQRIVMDLSGRRFTLARFARPQKRVIAVLRVNAQTRVSARARWRGGGVDEVERTAKAGETLKIGLRFDSIDEIEIAGTQAVLADLCWEPLVVGGPADWKAVPGFHYPLGLPLTHPDYPATGNAAEDLALFLRTAGQRVIAPHRPPASAQLKAAYLDLVTLVEQNPLPQHQRCRDLVGTPEDGIDRELGDNEPRLRSCALHNLLLAALRPEVAQVLGLYWHDAKVQPGERWDYLIAGFWSDPKLTFGADWREHLDAEGLAQFGTGAAHGYVVTELGLGPPRPATAPADLRCFHLASPTGRRADGRVRDWRNNVGLSWTPAQAEARLLPTGPVMYQVMRAGLGNGAAPQDPHQAPYADLTGGAPVVIALPAGGSTAPTPEGWPAVPLYFIDKGVADGWYGYRVQGVDLFGRISPPSDPGDWFDNDPITLHRADAIQVLHRTPPPPPAGVEAQALRAGDPYLAQADLDFAAAELSPAEQEAGRGGLRVQWRWPADYRRQAPDMAPGGIFHLFFHPGLLNAEPCRVDAVDDRGATSQVLLRETSPQPADRFAGAILRCGNADFPVAGNSAGASPSLSVDNRDPDQPALKRIPVTGGATLVFPPGHAERRDFRDPASWDLCFHDAPYDPATETYLLRFPVPGAANRWLLPLLPSEQRPMVYGAIGVSAVDSYGNQSAVAMPAQVVLVNRRAPNPPALPADAERVWASRADYHGHSHYRVRWYGQPHLRYVVCRALEGSLFRHDFRAADGSYTFDVRRQTLGADPFAHADLAGVWPDELNWVAQPGGLTRKDLVRAELNALWDALAPIRAALLALPAGTSAEQRALILDSALALYQGLSNDAMRVLAGLPDNAAAFSRVHAEPLDQRALDPDGDGTFEYLDRLEGRGRSRWFYRIRAEDLAHNLGAASLASPPVYMPDEAPPAAPRITRIVGADRGTRLQWAAHRPGMARRYRIHRAESREAAADVRLMGPPVADLPGEPLVVRQASVDLGTDADAVQAEALYLAADYDPGLAPDRAQPAANLLAAPTDLVAHRLGGLGIADGTPVVLAYRDSRGSLQVTPRGNAQRRWRDAGLVGGLRYYYRIVAVRTGDGPDGPLEIPSPASEPRAAAATEPRPAPVEIIDAAWTLGADGYLVRVQWQPRPDLELRLHWRAVNEGRWGLASGWTPATAGALDSTAGRPYRDLELRLEARTTRGLHAVNGPVAAIAAVLG